MKFKYIVLTMILSITSMQYTMFGMRKTAKITPTSPTNKTSGSQVKSKPKAQESIYNRELNALRDPNKYTKNQNILRALTGTASYNIGGGKTAVLNKITGTITYKNTNGKPTLQLSKTLNGKTKEIRFRTDFNDNIIGKTVTIYETSDPKGPQTVKEIQSDKTTISNYHNNNIVIPSSEIIYRKNGKTEVKLRGENGFISSNNRYFNVHRKQAESEIATGLFL
ncbi:MAG: hypothetical protein Q8Q60_03825 [Candidatus Chromulinivorax sp.]|nr:hypothetical protein [Candidatus Chromulinivorax sp.]